MIKFNQIVRAFVLSLTLAGGLAFAGHAFAYDQADIDAAQYTYDDDVYELGLNVSAIDLNNQDYDNTVYWCLNSGFYSNPIGCLTDGYDAWYARGQYLQGQVASWESQRDSDYAWLQTVTNDQNGMHGVP